RRRAHPVLAVLLQRSTRSSDPADPSRGNTHDDGVIRDVLGDHSAGGHGRPRTDGHGSDAHGSGTDRRTLADRHTDSVPVIGTLEGAVGVHGARVRVVREHHGRTDEDTVRERRGLVDERVVLHLAVPAHLHAGADVGAPSYDARLPHRHPLTYLGEVPDLAAVADRGILGDIGAGCDAHTHDGKSSSLSTAVGGLTLTAAPRRPAYRRGRRGTTDLRPDLAPDAARMRAWTFRTRRRTVARPLAPSPTTCGSSSRSTT